MLECNVECNKVQQKAHECLSNLLCMGFKVYGICTRGQLYVFPRVQIPYTLETHGTDDLCHSSFYSTR